MQPPASPPHLPPLRSAAPEEDQQRSTETGKAEPGSLEVVGTEVREEMAKVL